MTKMSNPFYLLDTNVFIEASNRYYGFDFCPAFWQWLLQQNENEKVFSINAVKDEIKGEDKLAEWSKGEGKNMFLPIDWGTCAEETKEVTDEVMKLYPSRTEYRNAFLSGADTKLIAFACAAKENCTIVTMERSRPNAIKRIKIPDICKALNVQCVDTFKMLNDSDACFSLGEK